MLYYVKLYALTFLGFLVIDMLWLGVVARRFYKQHLGELLADPPNWIAAILFYLLFIVGMLVFAVLPGLEANSLKRALLLGAFFGFITYATYDLTNLATIKNWPVIVTIVDMTWGTVLALIVSGIGFMAGRWLSSS